MFAGDVASFGEISFLDSGLGASPLDTVLFMRQGKWCHSLTLSPVLVVFFLLLLLLLKTSLIESHGCNDDSGVF